MFKWLRRKSSSSVLAQFFGLGGRATWFGHHYWNFAKEAYAKNIVAYHCIKRISESCADIPFDVLVNGQDIEKHPIIDLLNRPNPLQGYKTFMRVAITHRLISGNTYIWGNKVSTGRIMELTLMRPDRVTIETSSYMEPYNYLYTVNGRVYNFPIEPITQVSEVLHIKEPNPLDDLYGLSPISAASMSIDQHNESSEWNKKLLENSARPPGILTMKDKTDSAPTLSKEQLETLRETLNEKFAGYKNAGKIPVINFDMEWQSMGMTPTDMDWINGKSTTARDICLAFGYPAHLLGLPDGATFNNVSEAKLALYEETVIPLLQSMLAELSYYLSIHQNKTIEIVPDLDQVSALIPRRETARANARNDVTAGVITINEAREEIGYPPVPGGDEILVPTGRLPLNFDTSTLSKQQYIGWLKSEGFAQEFACKMADIAYATH